VERPLTTGFSLPAPVCLSREGRGEPAGKAPGHAPPPAGSASRPASQSLNCQRAGDVPSGRFAVSPGPGVRGASAGPRGRLCLRGRGFGREGVSQPVPTGRLHTASRTGERWPAAHRRRPGSPFPSTPTMRLPLQIMRTKLEKTHRKPAAPWQHWTYGAKKPPGPPRTRQTRGIRMGQSQIRRPGRMQTIV